MIFKGRCRTNGGQLADYLLSSKNERVRVLEVQGTVIHDASPVGLKAALNDFDQLTQMTPKGQLGIFHLVIAPDERDRLRPQDWQHCIAKAEEAIGLTGQPRAVVSHIYDGKEHLHVAYSRVDVDSAKMIELPFYKMKLVEAARAVELELGLERLQDRPRDPHSKPDPDAINAQKHQDERAAHTKPQRDEIIKNAWDRSANGQAFQQHIEASGYRLAMGNRGLVVLDQNHEPHSIARSIPGVKQKDVKAKLADLEDIPSVDSLRRSAAEVQKPAEPETQPTPKRAATMQHDEFKSQLANDNAEAEARKPIELMTPRQAEKATHDELKKQLEDNAEQERRKRQARELRPPF